MSLNPYVKRYQQAQVATLTPDQLLLMLVDGALLRAEQAEAGETAEVRRAALDKLRRIVAELVDSLNVDVGGEVAVGLMRSYAALLRLVARAHATDDPAALGEVARRVRTMHDLWHATVRKAREEED